MNAYPIDLTPEGSMLVSSHTDKPGIIGKVGTLLGDEGINIAQMTVGRKSAGQKALMVLNVDSEIPATVLERLMQIEGIDTAKQVTL